MGVAALYSFEEFDNALDHEYVDWELAYEQDKCEKLESRYS